MEDEILSIVEEEEIEDEIWEADLLNKLIQLTITGIDNFLENLRTPTKSVDAPKDETPLSPYKVVTSDFLLSNDSVESPVSLPVAAGNVEPLNNLVESPNPTLYLSLLTQETVLWVKLPKLDLRKFGGEVRSWPTFWDASESSIHENPSLAPVEKLNYLNSLQRKPAVDTISDLSLTASNYEAIVLFNKRFGNKQKIINPHMDVLLNVSPVTEQDTRKLKQLYDTLESQVRSLKSLGIPSSSYGSLLSLLWTSCLKSYDWLLVEK